MLNLTISEGERNPNIIQGADDVVIDTEVRQAKENFLIFFSGIMASDKGMEPLRRALAQEYGEGNSILKNSLVSFDVPEEGRFENLAKTLVEQAISGKKIQLVAHSLGTMELVRTLNLVEQTQPGFVKEHSLDIEIVVISPFGFIQEKVQVLSLLKRGWEVARTRVASSKRLLGIESVALFPIEGMDEVVTLDSMRRAFKDYSLAKEKKEARELPLGERVDYQKYILEKDLGRLQSIDSRLVKSSFSGNGVVFRHWLRERGKLLKPYIDKIDSDGYVDAEEGEKGYASKPSEGNLEFAELLEILKPAVPGMLALLRDAVKGFPLQKMEELKRLGVSLKFLVPEYDVLVDWKQIQNFFKDESAAKKNTGVLNEMAHSTFALQPYSFVSSMREMLSGERKQVDPVGATD